MSLTRDDILGCEDRPIVTLDVPEWNGTVCLRTLSGAERDALETKIARQQDWSNVRAWFAAACLCDDQGEPLFTAKDIDALGRKSAAALDRIMDQAQAMNGMSADDVEELAGN